MNKSPKWTMNDYQNNQIDYGTNFEKLYQAWLDSKDRLLSDVERMDAAFKLKEYQKIEVDLNFKDTQMRTHLNIDGNRTTIKRSPKRGMLKEVFDLLSADTKPTVDELIGRMIRKPTGAAKIYQLFYALRTEYGVDIRCINKGQIKKFWIAK